MAAESEKNEFDWLNSEAPRRPQKRQPQVVIGVPVSLFLIFFIVSTAMFGLFALVPLAIAAVLFFWFREEVVRYPAALFVLGFLLLGIMTWNFLTKGPVFSNPVASWIYHAGLDLRDQETTVLVSDDDFKPAPAKASEPEAAKKPEQDKAADEQPAVIEKPVETALKTEDVTPVNPANINSQAFDAFLNKGLKAVDDEQYDVANQNFKSAFKANPNHPRLKELAAEYRKTADEKCQDFKAANAKELTHIPNNYYQYAASLTQTVPLKCE